MKIVITIPDGDDTVRHADYVEEVARQMAEGYVSGHVDAERHWTTTEEFESRWVHPMDGSPCESGPLVEAETFCADHDRRVMPKEG